MARVKTDQPALPSLLDRLIDEDPDSYITAPKTYGVLLSDIKASIRRDLECLLNTRLYRQEVPEKFEELDVSIVNYGLPDFSVIQLGSDEGKEKFRNKVQHIIEKFEPRFRRVVVELEQIGEEYERTLYLKISAVLMIDPDPIPLLFDSRVKTMDKAVRLREINHG
ncbi:MAG: type VI secretion system baseplate subunit TssE [Cellvibrionaceae bacterium]